MTKKLEYKIFLQIKFIQTGLMTMTRCYKKMIKFLFTIMVYNFLITLWKNKMFSYLYATSMLDKISQIL